MAEMDCFGVECTVVSHWDAVRVHPNVGNRRLLERWRGQKRLLPGWMVLPHYTGESPEPEQLLRGGASKR